MSLNHIVKRLIVVDSSFVQLYVSLFYSLSKYLGRADDVWRLKEDQYDELSSTLLKARAKDLHELAICWQTIRKDLEDIEQHLKHLNTLAKVEDGCLYSKHASSSLEALMASCTFWVRWVSTYLDRTHTRINLVSDL